MAGPSAGEAKADTGPAASVSAPSAVESVGPLAIGVLGPGAIGSTVAAALITSGHDVAVFGRRRFDELVVESDIGHGTYPINYNDDPDAVGPVDVLFVALKGHQVESAAAWLAALVHDETIVVGCMNGVEHREQLAPFVSAAAAERIVPVVVMLPALARQPGRLFIRMAGALSVPDTAEGEMVAALFDADFLTVKTVDDFAVRSWRKLMMNAVSGGIATIAGRHVDVTDDAAGQHLVLSLLREIHAVAQAEGVELSSDLPERMAENFAKAGKVHLSSIVVDRLAGRPTEWRYRNEVVVRLAAKHNIDVPYNESLSTLLRFGEPA